MCLSGTAGTSTQDSIEGLGSDNAEVNKSLADKISVYLREQMSLESAGNLQFQCGPVVTSGLLAVVPPAILLVLVLVL